uniref:ABC-type branched-chain amino acid transport system, substrate-binding protein n=1 Tax=Candidatus Kentrum sp. TC TaxID=2126339 RepID=A0A450YI68_9GAMM|nr:MAG: ABC-type branched-chain amino acid transport system, substrate-binding protein [Candidatus Kentron sp. TC]
MGGLTFPFAISKAMHSRRDFPWGGARDGDPSHAMRMFRQSGYMRLVWFCCVLLVMVMVVSEGWASAGDDWAPSGICRYPAGFSKEGSDDAIIVALAGPLRTEKGREMLRGTTLRIEEANRAGGVAGKEIVLLRCDDGIDPKSAASDKEKKWQEVANAVADSEALVVVGHRSSNASIAAGKIYRERRIVAITGTAQADEVTQGNAWYFRTIPQTSRYLENMVHYANQILRYRKFAVIHIDNPFGKSLRASFEDALRNDGMENVGTWRLPAEGTGMEERVSSIVDALSAKNPDAVFLAIDDENVIPVIREIKERGLDIHILGSVNISKNTFPILFQNFPKEEEKPGYYTDGILAAAYFMFDISGRSADEFVNTYEEKFPGHRASTGAISTYDAAGLSIRAIEETYLHGKNKEERRANIRNYIASLNKESGSFYEGAMGRASFDEEGNSIRDIPMALLSNRKIISAPVQIVEITDPKELDILKRRVEHREFDGTRGHVFKVASKDEVEFFNKINAVYSGVRINGITEIDAEDLTYDLDAHLWFRFDEDPDLDVQGAENEEGESQVEYLGNIEFLNAVGEVRVIKEKSQESGERMGELGYSLYRIKGRFGALFDPEFYTHGERTLELNFRHRNLPRKRLIFVQDILSIYEFGEGYLDDREMKRRILNPSTGWEIGKMTHHLDIMNVSTLGDPKLFGKNSDQVEFSRHNSNIVIREIGVSVFGFSPSNFSLHLMSLGILILVLLILYLRHWRYLRNNWLSNPIIFVVLLILAELSILNWNSESMNLSYLNFVTKFTDILWWIVLGMILSFATKVFMFAPLEEKTGRKIPTIIPRMTAFTIYLFMLFGVAAFVFDYKITSLLATSGLLAMIIGLAVQSNLSNIFSGIALNLEHPFRIGDWVRIADFEEGKVINVTWRSVRIRTPDNHIVSIPNTTAAETVTHNFTPRSAQEAKKGLTRFEEEKSILGFVVHTRLEENPSDVKKVLREAVGEIAMHNPGILLEPEPVIRFSGIHEQQAGGFVARYEILVSIRDYQKKKAYGDRIWHGIWNRLDESGRLQSVFG